MAGELDARPHQSVVRALYEAAGARTSASRVYECGSLRIRHPRARGCVGVLLNTGGGIVAGDRLSIDVELGAGASVTLTTAAAEKVYRADGRTCVAHTRLSLAKGSRLAWVPQETILYDQASLKRGFEIDVADDATLIAAEIIVFGRFAHGERRISGSFRDRWRLRRGGRLVFADETCLDGAMSDCLDRGAVARGARAMAVVVLAAPDAEHHLDRVRATVSACCPDATGEVDGAASHRDGIVIARFLGHSAERLRDVVGAVLGGLGVPRV